MTPDQMAELAARLRDAAPGYLGQFFYDLDAAADLIESMAQRVSAIDQYRHITEGCEPDSPLERLRAFCSVAMSGQDWLDVEPFFDAAQRVPLSDEQIREAFEQTIWALNLPLDRRGDGYRSTYTNIAWQVAFGMANRLNRSMAQRVPLTVDRIEELANKHNANLWRYHAYEQDAIIRLIRAVECEHGIVDRQVEQANGIRSDK